MQGINIPSYTLCHDVGRRGGRSGTQAAAPARTFPISSARPPLNLAPFLLYQSPSPAPPALRPFLLLCKLLPFLWPPGPALL